MVERVGTGLHRAGGLVGGDDDTGARRAGADEPQGSGRGAVAEQFLAGAQVDGEVEQAVLVDEVVVDEGVGERAAAVDLQFVAGQLPGACRTPSRVRKVCRVSRMLILLCLVTGTVTCSDDPGRPESSEYDFARHAGASAAPRFRTGPRRPAGG